MDDLTTRETQAFAFSNEQDFCRFAADFAMALEPGDCVLLQGDLGAGKTTFARAAIRALAAKGDIEVPSPTFTLVQTYDLRVPVAHFDLYRITDPAELDELGLDEVTAGGIALMEWPERGLGHLPHDAIRIVLTEDPDATEGRHVEVSGPDEFMKRLARSLALRDFLADCGWRDAVRHFLLGDASTRAYETVRMGSDTAILMNAPRQPDGPPVRDGKPYSQIAHLAEDVTPFVAIAHLLAGKGFRAPEIHAFDLEKGIVLLEHLGDSGVIDDDRAPLADRYLAAVETLADMHALTWPREAAAGKAVHRIPALDRDAFLIETELMTDWFVPRARGRKLEDSEIEEFREIWTGLFEIVDSAEKAIVLRDFHSPNLIWNENAEGVSRVGLIDFQDALWGSTAYDVASVVQDARVDIPPGLQDRLLDHYCTRRKAGKTEFDEAAFRSAFAILAAQRATKILGIFVRLDERDCKPVYLKHIPRLQGYLRRDLRHPALGDLAEWYRKHGVLDANIESI
jgi:tRNA threonylcarbamoyl adenosine modification protein YjeE